MPYIAEAGRSKLSYSPSPLNAGEMQYAIAKMIQKYLERQAEENGQVRYQDMNDIMGALAGAQMEFYREVVAPYEDKKINENGAVYDNSKYGHGGKY